MSNQTDKQLVIDQGPRMFPASGYCVADRRPENAAHNRLLTELLRKRGGPRAFTHLPGDLSVFDDRLFVPSREKENVVFDIVLPPSYAETVSLTSEFTGDTYALEHGTVRAVPPGVYRMTRSTGNQRVGEGTGKDGS